MPQDIARVYQQCNPARPLEPGDRRYVSLEGVRGVGDPVMRLANAIRFSDSHEHLLFAGHRGGGKSTELLRLKEMLFRALSETDRFFVVYFEADAEDIDVNDVDFPDVLLAVIRQVARELRERLSIELRPAGLMRIIECLKRFWHDLKPDTLTLDLKIAKVTAALKSSPDARAEIRKELEPRVSSLLQAGNEMLDEAVTHLRAKEFRGLVLIVDNLDRIVLRPSPDNASNTHEQLFINRGGQLAQLRCHIVYTLPISMVFSPKATALRTVFNSNPYILPMVRVAGRDGKANTDGLNAMRAMVRNRLAAAETNMEAAFDSPGTLDHLCGISGGHARNLLILLRSACEWTGDLPIRRGAVDAAIRGMSNDFERALNRTDFFDVLRQIDKSHDLLGSDHDQLLLYNLSVLEYEDGAPFYAVNPAVRMLEKFAPAKRARSRRSS